jgi:hypothetical protein
MHCVPVACGARGRGEGGGGEGRLAVVAGLLRWLADWHAACCVCVPAMPAMPAIGSIAPLVSLVGAPRPPHARVPAARSGGPWRARCCMPARPAVCCPAHGGAPSQPLGAGRRRWPATSGAAGTVAATVAVA